MNMEEATIVKWHAQPGKPFRSGDVLRNRARKGNSGVAALGDGVMVELCVAEGENAEVNASVCWVEPDTSSAV